MKHILYRLAPLVALLILISCMQTIEAPTADLSSSSAAEVVVTGTLSGATEPSTDASSLSSLSSSSSSPFIPQSDFIAGDCHTTDLTVSTNVEANIDRVSGSIIFTNQSELPCYVHGYPTLLLSTIAGHPLPTTQTYIEGPDVRRSIAPQGTASMRFTWTSWCGKQPANDLLVQVRMPGQPGYLLVPMQTSMGVFIKQAPKCVSGTQISIEPFE